MTDYFVSLFVLFGGCLFFAAAILFSMKWQKCQKFCTCSDLVGFFVGLFAVVIELENFYININKDPETNVFV